jgi:hypothetical protein
MLHIEFMKFCQNHWSLLCNMSRREQKTALCQRGEKGGMDELALLTQKKLSEVEVSSSSENTDVRQNCNLILHM